MPTDNGAAKGSLPAEADAATRGTAEKCLGPAPRLCRTDEDGRGLLSALGGPAETGFFLVARSTPGGWGTTAATRPGAENQGQKVAAPSMGKLARTSIC